MRTIALDVDDVLMINVADATHRVGADISDISCWNLLKCSALTDAQANEMYRLFLSPEYVASQKPYPGAVEFVQALIDEGYDVIIASSVPTEVMAARAESIQRFFPMISRQNVMLGGRKSLLAVDVLVDDNPANLGGCAKQSILFSRPWNLGCSEYHRVENYADLLAELVP